MNNLTFTPEAWEDYLFWQKYDRQLLSRINELIKEVQRTPFAGRGKPEPLRFEFQGCWSRRINQEHRLIYKVIDDSIVMLSLRFHYK